MLYRFREAQAAELGLSRPQKKRPAVASEVRNLPESEKWRRQVLSEISRKVSKIQDSKQFFLFFLGSSAPPSLPR